MHQSLKALVVLFMGLMLVACGDSGSFDSSVTLDTSSEEAMEASIDAMTEGMDDTGKQELAGALATIMMIRGLEMMGQDLSREETQARMVEGLHGLTAAEIIAKAKALAEEIEAR